jgi:hypothetical protein
VGVSDIITPSYLIETETRTHEYLDRIDRHCR